MIKMQKRSKTEFWYRMCFFFQFLCQLPKLSSAKLVLAETPLFNFGRTRVNCELTRVENHLSLFIQTAF